MISLHAKDVIRTYCNEKYALFDKTGNGKMGYLFYINPHPDAFFLRGISKNPRVIKPIETH